MLDFHSYVALHIQNGLVDGNYYTVQVSRIVNVKIGHEKLSDCE